MRIRRRMSRADRALWQSARTLADLGNLTAQWLEGTIASQPAYTPRYGPDEETLPLVPALAAANRAGYLTEDSQPGDDGKVRGRHWQMRAAVSGFITDPALLTQLVRAAEHAELLTVLHPPHAGRIPCEIPITACDRHPVTFYGGCLGEDDLRAHYCAVGPQALADLLQATHLTIIDRTWGPSDRLWNVLHRVSTDTRTRSTAPSRTLSNPALYVPIGAAGSGKSSLCKAWPADAVLELDAFRAMVSGGDAGDQGATKDAVAALELVLDARLARGLTCVIDATNTDPDVRRKLTAAARRHGMPAVAIRMETSLETCHARNDRRPGNRRVPPKVLDEQFRQAARFNRAAEGFDDVLRPDDVRQLLQPLLADEIRDAAAAIHAGLYRLENLTRFQEDTALLEQMLSVVWVNRFKLNPGPRGTLLLHRYDDSVLTHLSSVLFGIARALPYSQEGRRPGTDPLDATVDTADPEAWRIAAQLEAAAQALDRTVGVQQIAPALDALAAHRQTRRPAIAQ